MSKSAISTFELFQMFPDKEIARTYFIDERNIFDCEAPDYASVNEHGVWCDFCGHLLVTPYHIDEDWSAPEYCPECGAPDIEEMGEYFA